MSDVRRQFQLPDADAELLDSRGLVWEAVVDGGVQWVVVHDYPLPPGYTATCANVALQIPASYPDVQIDMVYFCPDLARMDGTAIGRTSQQNIGGKRWQRWSRHRTRENPWRRGLDCVETHLWLVDEWLLREHRRAA